MSAKVFHLLVFPRRTLRHHECLSTRWYSTPLHLRLVDEHSQKTYGRRKLHGRRIRLKGQGSPKVQINSACMRLAKDVQRGAYSCNIWISQPLLSQLKNYDRGESSMLTRLQQRRQRCKLVIVHSNYSILLFCSFKSCCCSTVHKVFFYYCCLVEG